MTKTDRTPDRLEDILAMLAHRQRRIYIAGSTLTGVFYGTVAAALLAAIGLLAAAGWAQPGVWQVLWCVPAGAAVGALVGQLRRVDALRLARSLDLAASSQDRFASAVQLQSHHRRDRVKLIEEDALSSVQAVRPDAALRFRAPRQLRFLPLPAVLLAAMIWLAPTGRIDAVVPEEPEISAEAWTELSKDFREQLADLPEPRTDEEKELLDKLKKLADLLDRQPLKKDALEQIARLRSELEKRRENMPGRSLAMRSAARNIRSSSALKPFASQLSQGNYQKAADALKALADKLRKNAQAMSAEEFEAAASDFDRLAADLSSHEELGHACKDCAKAAESMNRDKLAEALEKFSKELERNSDELRQCDSMCRSQNLLDELLKKLNQCKSCGTCKNGQCSNAGCSGGACNSFVKRNNKKGGLKAGWGTADRWNGGQMDPRDEQRTPDLAKLNEQAGRSTKFTVMSRDETAESSLSHQELFAEYVQKAEADLALETAPMAYRDFLKRYFMAIRPQDGEAKEQGK